MTQKAELRSVPVLLNRDCICNGGHDKDKLEYERLWKHFGACFCICLKSRMDRFERASQLFHQYGLCRHARFYMTDPPTEEECQHAKVISKGRFGIWNSHDAVARLGLRDSNAKSVLVFEDDFEFRNEHMSVDRLRQVVHDYERVVIPKRFHVFKLGQHTLSGKEVHCFLPNAVCFDKTLESQWLSRIYQSQSYLLHAYVWSREGADKLFQTSFSHNAKENNNTEEDIDSWMVRKKLRMYNCYPQLVVQSGSRSSNVGNDTNRLRDQIERVYWPMLGSYFQRQYCNELDCVALYKDQLVTAVIMILCLCLALFLYCRTGVFWNSFTTTKEEEELNCSGSSYPLNSLNQQPDQTQNQTTYSSRPETIELLV